MLNQNDVTDDNTHIGILFIYNLSHLTNKIPKIILGNPLFKACPKKNSLL